ncbi:haloacid dehalogenase [Marinomonas sp. SBI22]|jgi:putative hydrolase of the HAD superfamily|uniref:HAD family hydrolase n=1 Tax=unclassified Marinomonas TaxID=196814 RepID=UPI0005FA8174|nr:MULTISPECIES: HAD family hydrolase [unclassified Marinomonas]KJZ13789.1 haloacid dehalogenase [Marinomonas sp. S3726]KZM44960.1 haloacid dehalogenase [Marinomonas sp. SBI22]KZM46659.1 haloacid dehalogenase [Marinomonas sp. SBI8L]
MSQTDNKYAISTIAFDADDTLWRNEEIFMKAQETFINMLTEYHDEAYISSHLAEIQVRNLSLFGYGIKGFTLSMIETAIELSEGRIRGHEIHDIITLAKDMVAAPIHLLPHVVDTVKALKGKYQLMVITKGDLLDQEGKLARSGIADLFDYIEIVSEKKPSSYQDILTRYQIPKESFLMLGNSMRSDVLPLLDIGVKAIHVPYHSTWAHEQVDESELTAYGEIETFENISELLPWLAKNA